MNDWQKALEGYLPSIYNENTHTYHYSTNYGTIEIDAFTKQVKTACVGFSDYTLGHSNHHIVIRILGDEFSIRTGTIYKEVTELASPNYPYKLRGSDNPKLTEVMEVLCGVKSMSQGLMAVFTKLLQLLERYGKVTSNSYTARRLSNSMMYYSRHILRNPVITRKPITSQ